MTFDEIKNNPALKKSAERVMNFYKDCGFREGIKAATSEIEELIYKINEEIPGYGLDNLGIADFNFKYGFEEALFKLQTRLINIINKSENK